MKRIWFVVALCCVSMLSRPAWSGAQVSGLPQGVKLSIGPVQGAAGQAVSIPVQLTCGAWTADPGLTGGLAGLQFEVLYDPAVLLVTTFTSGPLLDAGKALDGKVVSPGRAILILQNQVGTFPSGAIGVMAEIHGTVKGAPGQTTQLTIDKVAAYADTNELPSVPVDRVNGTLTVVGGGGGFVLPAVGGSGDVLVVAVVVLLGAVALGMAILVQRRRRS